MLTHKGEERVRKDIHPIVMLLAGPVLGLVYAVFLPFIGIAAVAAMVTQKAAAGTINGVADLAHFGWRPLEAYFGGKKAEDTKKEKKNEEDNARK